jgi:hypothetical protein
VRRGSQVACAPPSPLSSSTAGPHHQRRSSPECLNHRWTSLRRLCSAPTRRATARVRLPLRRPVRHHPGTMLVLADSILPLASRHRATDKCATAPSRARTVRGDHAASTPNARPFPHRVPPPRLDRAARPRPKRLVGWSRVAICHARKAEAMGQIRPMHCLSIFLFPFYLNQS